MTPTHPRFSRLVRHTLTGVAMLAILGGIAWVASPNFRAIVWLTGYGLHGKFDEWRFRPTNVWRSEDWKSPSPNYRYAVSDYVVEHVVAPGMNQRDVEFKLGPPDEVRTNGTWFYKTERPGWSPVQFSVAGLVVKFDDRQNVVRATKFLWGD